MIMEKEFYDGVIVHYRGKKEDEETRVDKLAYDVLCSRSKKIAGVTAWYSGCFIFKGCMANAYLSNFACIS